MSDIIKPLDSITIPLREYERLKRNSEFLQFLKDAGVQQWEGYEKACQFNGLKFKEVLCLFYMHFWDLDLSR